MSLSKSEHASVEAMADALGEVRASKALLISKPTLIRALAGRKLNKPIEFTIRGRLLELAAERAVTK